VAVGLNPPELLHPVKGIRLAALHSGIKADPTNKDLTLIEIAAQANIAAVFTTNKFCAAPVTVAQEHLRQNPEPRYLIINSGNANAGTGRNGYQHALMSCRYIASSAGVDESQVLPFSTGVIAQELPVHCIENSADQLIARLDEGNWLPAAEGIMTTDTLPKAISLQVEIEGRLISITGIAKGSGMIKPDMATMLSFIATDAEIDAVDLHPMLVGLVSTSFNAITVDGDTSTNDACVLIATGKSGQKVSAETPVFIDAITQVFQGLAQSIIRDGEGATKFVEVEVLNADSLADAREVGYTVAQSPLVKTALFASDPNWGRILAAVGRAKIPSLDIERVDLYLGDTCLLKNGLPDPGYSEEQGQAEMNKAEICIRINLNSGGATAKIWTSDLSYDYVKINAEYRS
jgi:glutamate N-acetyltransferase/amino-acid N-acetyltransferase